MEDPDSPSPHVVRDARQARILTEPESKRFFVPFLARNTTVKEAAQQVGCPLNTMLYRVKTLIAAGLVQVVETRPRGGRAIRVYRSVHDAYFIPLAATPFDTLEHRAWVQGEPTFRRLTAGYTAALRQHEHVGHLLYASPGGVVHTTDQPPTHVGTGEPLFFHDLTAHLTLDQAERIAEHLGAALRVTQERNTAQQDGQTKPYLVMLALIPMP